MRQVIQFCGVLMLCGLFAFIKWVLLTCDAKTGSGQDWPWHHLSRKLFSKYQTNLSDHCIEINICKDPNKNQEIYYYNRTDFSTQLARPINIHKNINNSYQVVPRKVHFILFSNGKYQFKFHFMLAIMAVARFVKPQKIYFWHDNLPVGKYWEETKWRVENLYFVHREKPTNIRGNVIRVVEHAADVTRLEVLLEYGGMYFDGDSIVLKPIDQLLTYDVTMGQSGAKVLANGLLFSKPWSDFFKIWHNEYKRFNDKKWGDHSVLLPYTLSERFPNLIHVESTSLCRPNAAQLGYLFGSKMWDWQHKNMAMHLYMRFSHGKGKSPEEIKTWNTTVGSVMRYIYFSNATLQSVKKLKSSN